MYVFFGAVIGLLFALVVYPLLLTTAIILSGDAYGMPEPWTSYSWYAGPIVGAFVGFILASIARSQDESIPERRVGVVIGVITVVWYGTVQVIADSYAGLAQPFMNSADVLIFVLVASSFRALIGMLLGKLGGLLFLRKASTLPSV